MTQNLHQRLRRATGLGAVAMLALPLAAQAADYRVQLSESFNSGLAAARPSITLRAVIDNGSGGCSDRDGHRALQRRRRSSHVVGLGLACCAATPGTQIGTFSSEITGSSAVRVLSQGTDTAGPYVRAGIDVPSTTAVDHRRRPARHGRSPHALGLRT